MAARFVTIDYDTPLLLPPNLREWVPAGHLAHFILDAVEGVDVGQVRVNERGTGSEEYPPRMLLALLLYCYATGVFSSRRIEQATWDSVPVRMISGDTHPDHTTISTFRRENRPLLQEAFVRVMELAQELKFLQVGQITVAVDGTKVLANASKHAAVQQERGEKPRGPEPKPPSAGPKASDQYNFTDPESRIMKAGNGQHFEQSYNAQAAVEVESRLIVGQRVSQAPNDKQELVPTLAAIPPAAGTLAAALVDSGFFSAAAVQQIEHGTAGPTVYAAMERTGHHRSVADLEQRPEPKSPAKDASIAEVMRHRLRTTAGK